MIKRLLTACLAAACALAASGLHASTGEEWRFRVLLDGREIGYHHFTAREVDGQLRLLTEASFEVRLLFVTLYRYTHQAEEIWRGDCLASITSATDANGKPLAVRGERDGQAFRVESARGVDELPACVMSFAYWNPRFLQQQHLLNSQNGEYLEVAVDGPVSEPLTLAGQSWTARRYRLTAGAMNIDLWYSEGGDWLALETAAQGGRSLRYERVWSQEAAS